MAKRKAEDDEDDGDEGFPDARAYALAILECLTAEEWIKLHELAAAHTAGRLSYRAWRTAAAHTVLAATRLMYEEIIR